jgi:hypothetical protein
MNEKLTDPEIKIFESQIMDKTTEGDDPAFECTIFEKAKKLYLDMEAFNERLSRHINHQTTMKNQHKSS